MLEREALERIVNALTEEKDDLNRVEKLETAISEAIIALWGEKEYDEKEVRESLDRLSVHLMLDRLNREDLSVFQAKFSSFDDERPDDVAQIIATRNPVVGSIIEHTVGKYSEEETSKYDIH